MKSVDGTIQNKTSSGCFTNVLTRCNCFAVIISNDLWAVDSEEKN